MNSYKFTSDFLIIGLLLLLVGCGLNPQRADIGLNLTLPEAKTTIYERAINKLGLMTEIYSNEPVKIMAKEVFDNTGTSVATSGEIPRDITEMVKSTLNGIGGNVLYIPYEPEFMLNTAQTGYSGYEDKILPQVVLSGGITEFDRGLVTQGDSFDIDIELAKYGLNFSDQNKSSLASVTLDFNMIDFKTFTGLPRIQAINGIKLHKATKEDSIGFTIKSVTFGARGEIKKVQGRHAAVRLLVQLNIIQLVGRYQKLPYWRLIPGVEPDDVVIDQVLVDYYSFTRPKQVAKVQELLYLHGFSVQPTGQMDGATQSALQSFAQQHGLAETDLNQELYLALYENVPLNHATRQLRKNLKGQGVIHYAAFEPTAAPQTSIDASHAPGTLSLRTNKSQYRIGDPMQIDFTVSEPMYVRIVLINSEGKIDTVFPNIYQPDNYCLPGKTYSIPAPGADFAINISGPVGTDKLRAMAAKNPIPADAMHFTNDGQFDESRMVANSVKATLDYVIR